MTPKESRIIMLWLALIFFLPIIVAMFSNEELGMKVLWTTILVPFIYLLFRAPKEEWKKLTTATIDIIKGIGALGILIGGIILVLLLIIGGLYLLRAFVHFLIY